MGPIHLRPTKLANQSTTRLCRLAQVVVVVVVVRLQRTPNQQQAPLVRPQRHAVTNHAAHRPPPAARDLHAADAAASPRVLPLPPLPPRRGTRGPPHRCVPRRPVDPLRLSRHLRWLAATRPTLALPWPRLAQPPSGFDVGVADGRDNLPNLEL